MGSITVNWNKTDDLKGYSLQSFVQYQEDVDKTYLNHHPKKEFLEATAITIEAQLVSNKKITSVRIKGNNSKETYFDEEMEKTTAYNYQVNLSEQLAAKGFLNYNIVVNYADGTSTTFPANAKGDVYDWNFHKRESYQTNIVSEDHPIFLFDAKDDSHTIVRAWRKGFKVVPIAGYDEAEYQIHLDALYVEDPENLGAESIFNYALKHFVTNKIEEVRSKNIDRKTQLVLKGRSLHNKPIKIQVALVQKDGSSYGKTIELSPKMEAHVIPINQLKQVKTVLLPRPYPTFLPYYFANQNSTGFKLQNVESVQIAMGPGLTKEEQLQNIKFSMSRIWLQ